MWLPAIALLAITGFSSSTPLPSTNLTLTPLIEKLTTDCALKTWPRLTDHALALVFYELSERDRILRETVSAKTGDHIVLESMAGTAVILSVDRKDFRIERPVGFFRDYMSLEFLGRYGNEPSGFQGDSEFSPAMHIWGPEKAWNLLVRRSMCR